MLPQPLSYTHYMADIFSKFTTHYQKMLTRAHQVALGSGRNELDIQDLLVALAAERGSLAAEIMEKHGLTPVSLHEKLGATPVSLLPGISAAEREVETEVLVELLTTSLTPAAKRAIERSVVVAWKHQHHYIGTEHLLYALVSHDEPALKDLWNKLKVEVKALKSNITSVLKSTSKFPDLTEAFAPTETRPESGKNAATPALEFFCTDLTSTQVQKGVDPVIGREREIKRLINILGRRTKNNPLLLGDPGVGKTAIVEGLAKRIIEGQVPEFLHGKRILALDLGLIVAGTMYRGEFEGRLRQVLDELKAHPEIIIFIDEVHTIVGTGAAPGSLDLANMLKPALAKGIMRCIGATTQEEYKKSIESDAALERRFQVVQVAEPSPDETLVVLKGIRQNYELFHHVTITDEAIEAAVSMSERYMPEKFLPDKAIDLIDEAASHLRTSVEPPTELKAERALEERLRQLQEAKELAIKEENFPLATAHKDEEKKVRDELDAMIKTRSGATQATYGVVGREQIAEIVSQVTGVSINELLASERQKLADLENVLNARVIGQEEAISAIASAVRRARLGLGNPARPIGSFIFLGPSGVGKTELAKVVAEQIFEDTNALIRLDMSEFSEAFNMSKLIGAPAGYVGYKDSNKLTDLIKRKPAAVVLFDEIEKAHPDVFNLLLQILEDGHLTDAGGKQVNFKNSLIIMTSNLGLSELKRQAALGFRSDGEGTDQKFRADFGQTKIKLLDEVKRFFRTEFLNRLDGVIVFNPLNETALERIVALQIIDLNKRFQAQKLQITVKLGRGAARIIARSTFSPDEGARGVRRFIQKNVEDQLSERLLHGKIKTPAKVTIRAKGDSVTLE